MAAKLGNITYRNGAGAGLKVRVSFKPRTITGWWLQPTSLKNMSSSVGMIIPYIVEHKKMFETTNQIRKHHVNKEHVFWDPVRRATC